MIGAFLLGLLPSFLQVRIRRLLGQHIGKGSRIRFGSIVKVKSLNMGEQCSIGPFCYIKADHLEIGSKSVIKPFSIISTRVVKFGEYVHIAPLTIISSEFTENSVIEIGDHSRIFPYCWLDTGEGIKIRKQVGVGAHSLIYTHGSWADYLDGAPISYGPVELGDNIWIPTRVTILPNVVLGKNTIVGANSLVNKSFPENVLIAGTPAKIIKENVIGAITPDEKCKRMIQILEGYSKYLNFKSDSNSRVEGDKLFLHAFKMVIDENKDLNKGDMLILVNTTISHQEMEGLKSKGISVIDHTNKRILQTSNKSVFIDFVSYLRRYGVRLYID